jgi:hypothetical protein
MKSNKSVTWTENTIFRERCSNDQAHTGLSGSINIPPGRWRCRCGFEQLFCTSGCLKRAFKCRKNQCAIKHHEFSSYHKIRTVQLYKKHTSEPESRTV